MPDSQYHGHTRLLHERQEYCWSRRASMVLDVKWTGAGHHGGAKCGWTSRPRGPQETRGPPGPPGDPGPPRRPGPEHQTQQSKAGPGFTILIQTLKEKVLHDAAKQSRALCSRPGFSWRVLRVPERLPHRL